MEGWIEQKYCYVRRVHICTALHFGGLQVDSHFTRNLRCTQSPSVAPHAAVNSSSSPVELNPGEARRGEARRVDQPARAKLAHGQSIHSFTKSSSKSPPKSSPKSSLTHPSQLDAWMESLAVFAALPCMQASKPARKRATLEAASILASLEWLWDDRWRRPCLLAGWMAGQRAR